MFPSFGTDVLHTSEDEEYNRVYPVRIQRQSADHWTPVQVAREAASMLVTRSGTRVLDIGCGPGKFCAIGATTTEGFFTGVEQRAHLAAAAGDMIRRQGIPRVEIIHGNIMDIRFSDYDAFYIYNPFQENILTSLRIDSRVEMAESLYFRYTEYVRDRLAEAPFGTRVVTYVGECEEIPACYECDSEAFGGYLKLWIKTCEPSIHALRGETRWSTSC